VSVTAIVHDTDDRFRELDDGTRRAWQTYSEQLREVPNADYERVEHESWEELQRELRRIERRRKTLTRNST
jgi:rubrerythrin